MSHSDVVVGVSALFHDSSVSIVRDREVLAAAQEERFTRRKNDPALPLQALRWALSHTQTSVKDISEIVFYENPYLKFIRVVESMPSAPAARTEYEKRVIDSWFGIDSKLDLRTKLRDFVREACEIDRFERLPRISYVPHHVSHAASAFIPSPFSSAAILVVDGVGEFATTSIGRGWTDSKGRRNLELIREIKHPNSLGLLYSAFTSFLGFRVNSGEYKVMGLGPYGKPVHENLILDNILTLMADGSFRLNGSFFDLDSAQQITSTKFEEVFGIQQRDPGAPLTQAHFDVAASIQIVLEKAMIGLARQAKTLTGEQQLVMAGGVALNCVANAQIQEQGIFQDMWVQPAAGDAGGALGAALFGSESRERRSKAETGRLGEISPTSDLMKGSYLGPTYGAEQIRVALRNSRLIFQELDEPHLLKSVVERLDAGLVVGWFQGPMEFGPRALGNRSIIADARNPEMQKTLNMKIKFRESFRPFAPAVLEEKVEEWFSRKGARTTGVDPLSAYMLSVADVRASGGSDKQSIEIPAVTHVDNSARYQTVSKSTNPLFHALLTKFEELTGCPVLVNTSFNVRGEPIVCSPSDAVRCFLGTNMDVLVMGSFLVEKSQNPDVPFLNYQDSFPPD